MAREDDNNNMPNSDTVFFKSVVASIGGANRQVGDLTNVLVGQGTFNTFDVGGSTNRLGFPSNVLGSDFTNNEFSLRIKLEDVGGFRTRTAYIDCVRVTIHWIDPTNAPTPVIYILGFCFLFEKKIRISFSLTLLRHCSNQLLIQLRIQHQIRHQIQLRIQHQIRFE